jgi:hypothetical protein
MKYLRPWLIVIGTLFFVAAALSGILTKVPVFCPLRRFTGIPCASCGLTRAMTALCHGDVITAVHYHLAAPMFFLVWIGIVLISCFELWTERDILGSLWLRWGKTATWLGLIIILAGWGVNLMEWAKQSTVG